MPETYDVAIIGGGVIGSAIAHRLGSDGLSVVLLESGPRLGLGASDAAMGGILTQTEPAALGPLSTVIKRSRDIYRDWLAEIISMSGVPVDLLEGGDIQVALDDEAMTHLESEVLPKWAKSPFTVEPLTAAEVRQLEPLLSETLVGGFLLPDELALDPRELMHALNTLLAGSSPARVQVGSRAEKVTSTTRSAVVELRGGGRIEADTVVVAAGHHSARFLPENIREHLFPIKGEALDMRPPGSTTYPLRHHVYAEIIKGDLRAFPYLVPRHDGRVAAGVTYEPRVSDTEVTDRARDEIIRGVAALLPESMTWPIERRWAGLRPGTSDSRPVVGFADAHGRVLAATGHSGLGITLAPVTAEMVSALVRRDVDVKTREWLDICRPDREFVAAASSAGTPAPTIL
ncbi:NAD(P)/FAD-dependent oxidoreductase [Planotetraspora kaengkrachanensis]|uniref:Glycine oxidase ThiO n=1 Tax=Planotetraspora kaengkrachanensis TaxID=575193 RepID=A0A8J3M5T2_9ACTN|nr:FAD-dependent oxidoreductase [Planotetraspora kaengkrachanensis]GIG79840.1 glycine oxidase ThiO [Planotetraspora kaengkrachanensis]